MAIDTGGKEIDIEKIREEIRAELQAEICLSTKIVQAVGRDFSDVYYTNMDTDQMWTFRSSLLPNLKIFESRFPVGSYESNVDFYVNNFVYELDRPLFEPVLSCEKLKVFFEHEKSYNFFYRSIRFGDIHYCQCQVSIIDDNSHNFVLAVRNVDKEKHAEMEWQQQLEDRMAIVQSMTKLYDNAVYVDLRNNTFQELRTINSIHNLVYDSNVFWDQIKKVCNTAVLPEYRQRMLDFVDVNTLEERMKNKNVLTEQYVGAKMGWSEAYIIVGTRDVNGKLQTMFYATRCIHEEKMKELAQQKKEKEQTDLLKSTLKVVEAANKAKTTFLSNVSHDIRTPLNGIIGMTAIAESNLDNREQLVNCLHKIAKSGEHLLSLINEVLDMSHIESGKMELLEEPFDLLEVINSNIDVNMPEIEHHKHEFKLTVDPNMETKVLGDSVKLGKIVGNLLSNMIKYTPDGGKLKMDVWQSSCSPNGFNCYKMAFEDNGIGIADDLLELIFEPFSRGDADRTSKIQGTGLGLPIVRSIVKLMSGDIQVKSKVNEGTRFEVTVMLKVDKSAVEAMERIKAKMEHEKDHPKEEIPVKEQKQYTIDDLMELNYAGRRILIAEDNDVNAEIVRYIFEAAGLDVDRAVDGQDALDKIREHDDWYYSIVFMDIQMPRMDGYVATKNIRRLPGEYTKNVPIVAMTANAFASDVEKAFMAGMNGHIAKPINLNLVVDALTKWIK